jgi:hypothetical protein
LIFVYVFVLAFWPPLHCEFSSLSSFS